VVDYLHEKGLSPKTIGIAGLTSGLLGHVRETEGEVNWQSVEIIKQAFPESRVVSATDVLGEVRYQKSDAEIEFIRKGVGVSQQCIATVQQHARAGVPERHVYGEMMRTNAVAGGSFTPMFGWISGPLGNTFHRVEQPTFRTLQLGDVLSMEIEGRWGGYIAQLDRTFSIGPAHQDLKDGLKQTWESFDRAFEALRPGASVAQVFDAAHLIGLNGRCETRLLMHGRGTGDDGPLITTAVTDAHRTLEIKEGCCFVVKPNTSMDGKPDYGSWGEVVVVRKDGAERLGTLPQELYELL
jgi:Xaa-Pro aminopeptidase